MAVSARSLHRWLTVLIALPFGVVLFTGLLLHTRSFNPWMQSEAVAVPKGEFNPDMALILTKIQAIPEAEVQSWADVKQIDMRPDKGLIRVRSKKNFTEVQVSTSGEVLQVAPRRTSWITQIHDGAFFGDALKWGYVVPSSVALLVMYFTGLWLFAKPFLKVKRVRRSSVHVQQGLSLRS